MTSSLFSVILVNSPMYARKCKKQEREQEKNMAKKANLRMFAKVPDVSVEDKQKRGRKARDGPEQSEQEHQDDIFEKTNKYIENWLNKRGNKNVWVGAILASFVIIMISMYIEVDYRNNVPEEVSHEEFVSSLEAGDIDTIYYSSDREYMRYTLLNDETREMTRKERDEYSYPKSSWRMTLFPGNGDISFRREMLDVYHVKVVLKTFDSPLSGLWSLVLTFGMFIGFVAIILVVMQSGLITGVNKNFAPIETNIDTRFKDVIGQDEVLKDLQFIVDMMQGKKLDAMGADIPKGILLSGPPGTGKTLIARAVAGEAGVPFFSANASEFIEMYVGVGAKTVRTLFKQARKHKPCIVFIDEIDAVAAKRGATGSTSEDNKTVNALLQEMDGFNKGTGVFIMAATNNPDMLDPAIVRSGRFDRQVVVNPPRDWTVRKKLFDLYIKNTKCDVDIDTIAKQTVGFTGADINAVVNEAKLTAAMQGKDTLDLECFEIAIDKKLFKSNRTETPERYIKDVRIAAYHEAGHAIMNYLSDKPIARATIIGSASGVGGVVFQADKDTGQFSSRTEYENQIRICYAGRVSEKIKFGEDNISDGAGSDITQATKLIYVYVCKAGMNDTFGALDADELKQITPWAIPMDIMREMSVKFMKEAEDLLRNKYYLVESLAQKLLERETLSGTEIYKIIEEAEAAHKQL